ncbi:MAG: hypothetical protein ACP5HQ_01665 [Thermoprotei archaeon]
MKRRNHAVYFLGLLSYVVSLVPFTELRPLSAAIALAMSLYVFPVLDYLQPKFATWKLGARDVAVSVASGLPYAVAMILSPSLIYAVPALLLGATLLLHYRRKAMWGNVVGTAFVASLSFVWSAVAGNPFVLADAYWTAYAFFGAVYVEYKLPFRQLSLRTLRVAAVTVALLLAVASYGHPLLIASLAEPLFRAVKPGGKLGSAKEIKALGRKGAWRDVAFVVVLSALCVASELSKRSTAFP